MREFHGNGKKSYSIHIYDGRSDEIYISMLFSNLSSELYSLFTDLTVFV